MDTDPDTDTGIYADTAGHYPYDEDYTREMADDWSERENARLCHEDWLDESGLSARYGY